MPGKGKFPREEGFHGGPILLRKWGSECFWGSILNECALLTKAKLQKVTQGATVSGRMTVVLYTTVKLPGSVTVVYIYRRYYSKET